MHATSGQGRIKNENHTFRLLTSKKYVDAESVFRTYFLWLVGNSQALKLEFLYCLNLGYTGAEQIGECLKGSDVVVIPAGVPRKPGSNHFLLLW